MIRQCWRPSHDGVQIFSIPGEPVISRLALILAFTLPLFAQSSCVSGLIRDNQNDGTSGAVISLLNVDTSTPRKTLSTRTGDYVCNQIPPGNYTLEAQMPGFGISSQQLRLQVKIPLAVNIQREVGQLTETINVMGESTVVNTQNATLGNAFTEVQGRQLPLQTRHVVELLSLQPGVANQTFPGSDLDALNDMDRERLPNGSCISVTGCNTLFPFQNASMRAWFNNAYASYHGGQLVLRRPVTNGWGFDFTHSPDILSVAESGADNRATVIQKSFHPKASYGSSDLDIRHNITSNKVVELPFGKGKSFLNSAPGWVNQFVGGWQITALTRYRTGLPLTISNGGVYPINSLAEAFNAFNNVNFGDPARSLANPGNFGQTPPPMASLASSNAPSATNSRNL